jgi:hypothetical protein
MGKEVKTWPLFMEAKKNSLPQVMELNPQRFGHILNDPYHGSCDLTLKKLFE